MVPRPAATPLSDPLTEAELLSRWQAPHPLYRAALTASLHDIEQEISKTIHKGLELAIKKGKAKRPSGLSPAATGQGLLAL